MMLTFKLILNLNNNWEEYKRSKRYPIQEVEIKEVEKMLNCMNPEKGYSVYICKDVTFVYEREGKVHTVVMDKFEFLTALVIVLLKAVLKAI